MAEIKNHKDYSEKELIEILKTNSALDLVKKETKDFTSLREVLEKLKDLSKNIKTVYTFKNISYKVLSPSILEEEFKNTLPLLYQTFTLKMPILQKQDPLVLNHIKTQQVEANKKLTKKETSALCQDLNNAIFVFYRDYESTISYPYFRILRQL